MNSTIAILLMIGWLAVSASTSIFVPWIFSDQNRFLKNFVNHEFLGFMGIIVTITLASASNLFVELTRLEDRLDREVFPRSKKDVRDSCYALVGALLAAVFTVVAKGWVENGLAWQSFANCLALGIIIFSICIMIDLVQAAFSLDMHGS